MYWHRRARRVSCCPGCVNPLGRTLIRFARDRDLTRIEATGAGAGAWTDHVIAASEGLLFTEVDSWMTGINRNVEGKQVRRIMRYSGGHPKFRERCEAVVADGYRELSLA